MTSWMLSLKRLFRARFFLVTMAALLLGTLLCAGVGDAASSPTAGYVYAGPSTEISDRVTSYLDDLRLIRYEDEEALRRAVSTGRVDTGILLREDLDALIREADVEDAVTVLHSVSSVFVQMFAGVAGSAVFKAAAPYVSLSVLKGMKVDAEGEEVVAAFDGLMAAGDLFDFRVEIVNGEAEEKDAVLADGLIRLSLGLLLFVAVVPEVFRLEERNAGRFSKVLGVRRTLTEVFLPDLCLRALCLAAASLAALGMTGADRVSALAVPVMLDLLLLLAAGVFLREVLPVSVDLRVLFPVWLLVSLPFCPAYLDMALYLPAAGAIRLLLPPTWIWLLEAHPLRGLIALAALTAVDAFLLLIRIRRGCRRTEETEA